MKIGHYQDRFAFVLVPIVFSNAVTDPLHLSPTTDAVLNIISFAATVLWLFSCWAESKHNRNLCLLDLEETPLLDPQGAVDRDMWKLKIFHSKGKVVAVMGVFFLLLITANVLGTHGNEWAMWFRLALIFPFVAAYLVVTEVTTTAHRRLYPWCPFCKRRRDDDDEETTPAPQPQPTGTVNA
jgi:hypothetical protein